MSDESSQSVVATRKVIVESKYFEDWVLGEEFSTERRTIEPSDAEAFAVLNRHQGPLHHDAEAAEASMFGKATVHGSLTAAVAIGLMGSTGLFDGVSLAMLSSEVSYKSPVHVGDEIWVRFWASEKRTSSNPERGILRREFNVLNGNDVVVCDGAIVGLWARRPAGSS